MPLKCVLCHILQPSDTYCNMTDEVCGLINNFFFIQGANVKADAWFCTGLT